MTTVIFCEEDVPRDVLDVSRKSTSLSVSGNPDSFLKCGVLEQGDGCVHNIPRMNTEIFSILGP